MGLDRERLAEILNADYGFYYDGSPPPSEVIDERLKPDTRAYIGSHVQPGMRLLDVGCGNGETLLAHSGTFAYGVGTDHDPAHLKMAIAAREDRGASNVEFRELVIQPGASELPSLESPDGEPYDLVFTERGPFGRDEATIRALLGYVRPGGLIFAEMIGERHHQEMRELFGPRHDRLSGSLEEARAAMERAGVEIRVAADFVSRRSYPDVYEWLRFQCHIWAWGGRPFPTPDDPRLELFAERNRPNGGGGVGAHGESIVTTHHVAWIGGVRP